jgi:hypothetical protein
MVKKVLIINRMARLPVLDDMDKRAKIDLLSNISVCWANTQDRRASGRGLQIAR